MTPGEQRGELPNGWAWVTLREMTEKINPGFPSGRHNQEGRGVPHLRPMNISTEGNIDLSKVKFVEVEEYEPLQKGDVLFNNTNSPELVGKTAYIGRDANWTYSNHMTRIRPYSEFFDSAWIAYSLHHLFHTGYFKRNCRHHVNQASINTRFLAESVGLPLPPLPEQHRIVEKIKDLFTKLDAALEHLKAAAEQSERYEQSVLGAAVEGRLTSEWRQKNNGDLEPASRLLERLLIEQREEWERGQQKKMRTKRRPPDDDDWKQKYKEPAAPDTRSLSELPDGWVWATYSQIGRWTGGGTPRRSNPSFWEGGTIPWVTPKDMKSSKIHSSGDKITEIAVERSAAKRIDPGSLLFVVRSGILKHRLPVGLTTTEVTVNQDLKALTPSRQLDRDYLLLCTRALRRDIRRSCTKHGTTVESVEFPLLQAYPIPLPALREQKRVVEEVDRRLTLLGRVQTEIGRDIVYARRLRQSIQKKAFTGGLVPQDPSDEPASALLMRTKKVKSGQGQRRVTQYG